MFQIHQNISLKKLYLYLMQILQLRLHVQDTQLLYRNFATEIHIGEKGTWRENGVFGNANWRLEHLHLSIFI